MNFLTSGKSVQDEEKKHLIEESTSKAYGTLKSMKNDEISSAAESTTKQKLTWKEKWKLSDMRVVLRFVLLYLTSVLICSIFF